MRRKPSFLHQKFVKIIEISAFVVLTYLSGLVSSSMSKSLKPLLKSSLAETFHYTFSRKLTSNKYNQQCYSFA